jgi:phosphonate transport system substrate-binding protein
MRTVPAILPLLALLQFCQFLWLPELSALEGSVLVFGRVHDDPVRAIRDRQEFVDYLAKKMQPAGVSGAKILVVEKLSQLARAVKEGKVDLFHDSVVPTMVLSRWSGSLPILRQWKSGEADYDSVILVKKNSGINLINDLKGKVIAFDEPHSTSAHILARMLLSEKNLKMMHLTAGMEVKPDAVGYMFGSDGSAINFLISGRSAAAATSSREYKELRPEIRDSLSVLGTSISVPRQLLSIRKDLSAKLQNGLKEVLISMDDDEEGRQVLKRQQKTTKFDEIPPSSLEKLRAIEKFVFALPERPELW